MINFCTILCSFSAFFLPLAQTIGGTKLGMLSSLSNMLLGLSGFLSIIVLHEFGHFIFCKIFGVHTPTFSIGAGPALLKTKIGQTNFQLSALPLGGYVEIHYNQNPNKVDPKSFDAKPYWQKFLIMIGGILFNFITAFAIYLFLFISDKMPSEQLTNIKVNQVLESSLYKDLFQPDDLIFGVNDVVFAEQKGYRFNNFHQAIQNPETDLLKLHIIRDQKPTAVEVVLPKPGSERKLGLLLTEEIEAAPQTRLNLFECIKASCQKVFIQASNIAQGMLHLFKQRSLAGAAGPIMILSQTFKTAKNGMLPFLLFIAFLSINLGLINLIPLGILDGGQILTVSLESLLGRPLPLLKNSIMVISAVLLGGLMIFLCCRELWEIACKLFT